MNILPLHTLECGPPKPRKYPPDVTGTPNNFFGHRLRERSCRIAKDQLKQKTFFERLLARQDDERDLENVLKTFDFEKHSNRKINNKRVRQRVQQGMAAYEEAVNVRRDKLRELILREEMNLTHEVVYQAQHGDDARLDEMRRRIDELHKRQEEQRLAVVAAKRMQQYLAACPDVREKMTKKFTVEAKNCNVAQMADNAARKEADKELDYLWHRLMLKEVEAKQDRDVEDLKRRHLMGLDVASALAKQMDERLALEEEKKRKRQEDRDELERLWEELRQEEMKNLETERRAREALKNDLQEQILIAKRQLAERARKEAEMDQMLKHINEEELERERSQIKDTSAALRKELLAYLQYMEDLRREDARRDMEVDAIVEQSMKDAQTRRDLAVKKYKEARERGLQEVLRGREEQLRMKCQKEREEFELKQKEREMVEKEIEMNAKLTAEAQKDARNRAKSYGKELKEQQKFTDETRRLELEEEENKVREQLKRDEEYQKLTDELMEASENIMPHPFKIVLKECAARHAAEKAGLCYCPPPLPAE